MIERKTVIVTGASSGIGKACAAHFASQGYAVVMAARDEAKLADACAALNKAGHSCAYIVTDVSVESDCSRMVQFAVDQFGSIDVLINNAGLSMRGLFEKTELDVLRKLMDVNFWGTVYATKYALPYLLASKGSVVGVSSIAGKKGLPGRTGYSASKFAMEGFLETLRTENLKTGLHVLVACPGFTASEIRSKSLNEAGHAQEQSPREEQKMMQPEEVAAHIYKAVMHRKRDLVLTPVGKLTLLLNTLFPSWSDKLTYNHMAKEPDSPFK